MGGTFGQRIGELAEQVGDGILRQRWEVNQVYAKPIHEGYWETGPLAGVTNEPRHGGEQFFLSRPLMEEAPIMLERIAHEVLDGGILVAAERNATDLVREVFDRAPRLFNVLRNSTHAQVFDGEAVVFDLPPGRDRLERAALEALRHPERLESHFGPGVPMSRRPRR